MPLNTHLNTKTDNPYLSQCGLKNLRNKAGRRTRSHVPCPPTSSWTRSVNLRTCGRKLQKRRSRTAQRHSTIPLKKSTYVRDKRKLLKDRIDEGVFLRIAHRLGIARRRWSESPENPHPLSPHLCASVLQPSAVVHAFHLHFQRVAGELA